MRVRYLTGALNDLRLIHEYISRDNPNAARRIITALQQQAQALTQHPQIGKPGQVQNTREQVHGRYPYIIAYRIQSDEIQILGIVHSSRKWPEDF